MMCVKKGVREMLLVRTVVMGRGKIVLVPEKRRGFPSQSPWDSKAERKKTKMTKLAEPRR